MRAREECSVVRPVVFCEDVSHSHVADFGSYRAVRVRFLLTYLLTTALTLRTRDNHSTNKREALTDRLTFYM